MKKSVSFLFLLILAAPILAGEVVLLPDLQKPENIVIDQNQILITQFPYVYIYSLKDFTLIKKFGKAGEGPQEFSNYVMIQVHPAHPDYIIVGSRGKMSFFTWGGKFVKEVRSGPGSFVATYKPIGGKYANYGILRQNKIAYLTVDIYNSNFKKIKEVIRWKKPMQRGKPFNPTDIEFQGGEFSTFDKKIFVLLREKGNIEVFDDDGKKQFSINYDYERIPVTTDDIKAIHHFFKTDPRLRQFYETLKSLFKFPQYFPSARTMAVADNKTYVLTNKKRGGKSEFIIFDIGIKGKFLKKSMVPFKNANPLEPYPFTIKNGKLFQLVDNEETEEWELHIHAI